jgi:hypothetical protein
MSDGPREERTENVGYGERQGDRSNEQHDSEGGGAWWHWDGGLVSSRDTLAQWIMTVFTVVAAALLFGTLRIARDTLLATQDMARDTSRIGEAQVRAYPVIRAVEAHMRVHEDGVSWQLEVTVRNTGQSPAKEVTVHLLGWPEGSTGHRMMIGQIGSGGEEVAKIPLFTPLDELRFVHGGKDEIAIGADLRVQYRDVFKAEGEEVAAYYVGWRHLANEGHFALRRSNTHRPPELEVNIATGKVSIKKQPPD